MPDNTPSRSRSRSQDKGKKHKRRKHGSGDSEDPVPASHKRRRKPDRHRSSDRDNNKDAKKTKKGKKEKKKSRHKERREERKKVDLLENPTEDKGEGQWEGDKINQVKVTAAHLSESSVGVENKLENQQTPVYCQPGTASVIGQIRVSEHTRRRIADGGCPSIDADDGKGSSCCNNDSGVIVGSFGRLSPLICEKKVKETTDIADRMNCRDEDKQKRRRSSSPSRRRSPASCRLGDGGKRRRDDRSGSSSSREERRKTGQRVEKDRARRSSRRESRTRRRKSRSRSGSSRSGYSDASSDLSVKRGSDGGRLKIDRERLRRRALENTVLRLDERCPRKLADLPCFKALGVRVSELEEICRRLAPSRQSLEKVDAAPATASTSEHQQQGSNKQLLHAASSQDPAASPVCVSSTAVRHPFQLRAETSAGSGASSSRFGGSLLTATGDKSVAANKPLDKKELLSAFPVSSGEFHRHHDNTSALTAPKQPDPPSVTSAVRATFVDSNSWAAVDTTATLAATRVVSSSAGIKINISQHSQLSVDNQQPLLQPWVPVASTSTGHHAATSHAVAPAASAAVQQQRVLQLGDWATAKLLAAKSTPQTLLQQQQQQQQRSKSPQAWVTKHQFECARPITGGIGRQLMEKMGWRHGQGLGKRNEGPTEPLAIDFKTDRKGLASLEDKQQQLQQSKNKKNKSGVIAAKAAAAAAAASTMLVQQGQQCQLQQQGGKHPVSTLMELTKQRRWPDPLFRQVDESGPPHDRCFVFCVRVFGTEYQPDRPSKNKKDAKASAATLALQKLGILPTG